MNEGVGRGKCRCWAGLAAAVAVAGVIISSGAHALTADGSIMTNTAMATFSGLAGIGVQYKSTYLASSNVMICNPKILYNKTATPTMIFPTGTVTFTLCIVNNSITTSAFNMTITDQLPDNMSYQQAFTSYGGTVTMSRAAALGGPYTNGEPASDSVNPMFLRWTVNMIGVGPGKSACVSYLGKVL